MNWLLIALAFVSVQPKDAEHARTLSNRRVVAERKAEVPVPGVPLPGAGSIITESQLVLIDGKPYLMTVTLTPQELPPPPPPPGPAITGVRAAGGTAFVTEVVSGAAMELVGAGLPTSGQLRLTVGDKTCPVTLWTPTLVLFKAPAVTTPFTGPVKFWQQINNNWTLVAQGGSLTLKPAVADRQLPKAWIFSFLDRDGLEKQSFLPGEPITLVGTEFGAEKGRVFIEWREVPVTRWSDTRIETTTGDTPARKAVIEIRLPDGSSHAAQYGVRIGP